MFPESMHHGLAPPGMRVNGIRGLVHNINVIGGTMHMQMQWLDPQLIFGRKLNKSENKSFINCQADDILSTLQIPPEGLHDPIPGSVLNPVVGLDGEDIISIDQTILKQVDFESSMAGQIQCHPV